MGFVFITVHNIMVCVLQQCTTSWDLFCSSVLQPRDILQQCTTSWDLFCSSVLQLRDILQQCTTAKGYFVTVYNSQGIFCSSLLQPGDILQQCTTARGRVYWSQQGLQQLQREREKPAEICIYFKMNSDEGRPMVQGETIGRWSKWLCSQSCKMCD